MTRETSGRESNGSGNAADRQTATRRSVLRAAAAGATGLAVGSGAIGSGTASGIPTPPLTRCGNRLLDPTGQAVILRGVSIADPGRQLRPRRGQTADETVALALDESAEPPSETEVDDVEGWHNDVIRIPIQPQDVYAGTDNASANPASAMPHGDAWGPVLPGETGDSPAPITEETLTEYFGEVVDPLLDQIERAGAYAMLAYHRHYPVYQQVWWPGDCDPTVGYNGGNCGERGVLWHGPEQAEAVESNASDAYVFDHEPWTEPRAVAEALDEELTTFWRFVADEYADRDHVLFDVYPEPTGPYAEPWGTPDRHPGGNVDAPVPDPREEGVWWDLWLERAQPWIDVVEENAPGSVAAMGSPRWSRYTHHAGVASEFDVDTLQLCYTGQIQMQDYFDLSEQFGPPSDEVPLFFSGFGWAEDGGRIEDPALEPHSSDGYFTAFERFEDFADDYPVHPIASFFDHTWSPTFFDHEGAAGPDPGDWMDHLASFESRPGQWWMEYLARMDGEDDPSDGSDRNPCGDRDTPYPIVGDNERRARDPDGDGLLEDVNGNGETDLADAVDLYQHRRSDEVRNNVTYFDFSGNDSIDLADVVQLFRENAA